MAHSETYESNVFRKYYGNLHEAVQTADSLALHLYSEGLISKEARRDIEETAKADKNEKLLAAVERMITVDPGKIEDFLCVLDREEYLHSLVETIQESLRDTQLSCPVKYDSREFVSRAPPVSHESNTFRKFYYNLYKAIQTADILAIGLYSEGMISKDVRQDIEESPKQADKNKKLLAAVERVIMMDPGKLKDFLSVLDKEEYLHSLLEQIRISLGSTSTPPKPNKRKVASWSTFQVHTIQMETAVKSDQMRNYCQYIRAVYTRIQVPDVAKWPHIRAKKPIHLACVKKEKVSRGEADEYTRDTIHGNVDDILHKKESMNIQQVACLDEDGSYPDCVLIEGAPGVGKTTLACLLCKKWSNGELLKPYQLVILLRLRDKRISEASTIMDLFQHPDTAVQESVSQELQRTLGSGVLLILEGFDELPVQQRLKGSLFLDVLQSKHLPLATKLVTSRHSATDVLRETCNILQHVEILGFRKTDIDTYIISELAPQGPLLEDFKKYLKSYPYIYSMMYVPLNCAIVVEVYQNYKNARTVIPKTSTELYGSLIRALLLKHLYDHCWPKQELESFTQLPGSVYCQFISVCEIAYKGIQEQKLIFHDLSCDLETLGLMQSVTELYADTGHSISHNFLHLTIQEFLAAYYVSSHHGELLKHFREHRTRKQFEKVLTFLAGLSKLDKCSPDCIKPLVLSSKSKSTIELQGLHWLFEAQNPQLISSVLSSGTVVFKPTQYPNPFDCYTLGYCVACSNCMWKLDFADCHIGDEEVQMLGMGAASAVEYCKVAASGYISDLDLRNNTLTSECLEYLKLLPRLNKLTRLDFCKNKLDSRASTALAKYLPLIPNLDNICLSLNPIGCGGTVTLLSQINQLHNLGELGLYNTRIGHVDIEEICKQLPRLECLMLLDVGSNKLKPESTQLIFDSLLSNIPLKRLAMSYTQLCSEHITQLAQILTSNTNLEALYLQGCCVKDSEACKIAQSLSNPNATLKILNLNENELEGGAGVAFAKALKNNSSLSELWLAKNKIGETATNALVNSLRQTNQTIQILKLPVAYQLSVEATVPGDVIPRVVWN